MRVNAPSLELASPPSPAAAADASAGAASFAELHAGSLASLKVAARPTPGARTATASTEDVPISKPGLPTSAAKAEKYEAVPGEKYEEIVSGPRNGMYVNRSGNVRDGEAFVMVKRGGREFHVYGTGADRQVVPVAARAKDDAAKPAAGGERASKAVEYSDVPNRAYDEITSGPRNGMFVNRSGNARDGQAFVLVERAKHEVHIYGTGRNRLVVRVVPPQLRADQDAVKPAADPAAPETPAVPVAAPVTIPVAGTPTSGSSVLLG